jgi:hypothetical protein
MTTPLIGNPTLNEIRVQLILMTMAAASCTAAQGAVMQAVRQLLEP